MNRLYHHAGTRLGEEYIRWSAESYLDEIEAHDDARHLARLYGGQPVVEYWDAEHGPEPGCADVVLGCEDVPPECPHCGHPNPDALAEGAVDGPREYHADCHERVSVEQVLAEHWHDPARYWDDEDSRYRLSWETEYDECGELREDIVAIINEDLPPGWSADWTGEGCGSAEGIVVERDA